MKKHIFTVVLAALIAFAFPVFAMAPDINDTAPLWVMPDHSDPGTAILDTATVDKMPDSMAIGMAALITEQSGNTFWYVKQDVPVTIGDQHPGYSLPVEKVNIRFSF